MNRLLILVVPALLWGACILNRGGSGQEAEDETTGGTQSGGEGGDLFAGTGGTDNQGAQGGSTQQGPTTTSGMGGVGGMSAVDTCLNNEDCDDANAVCDPQLAICDSPAQCTNSTQCASTEICIDQAQGAHGACYTTCQPYTSSCDAGQTCVDPTGLGNQGICLHDGSTAHLQSCIQPDIGTDCIAGHACFSDLSTTYCLELCDFWGNGSCTVPGEHCYPYGACDPRPVDLASLGSSCNPGNQGQGCAVSGDVARGVCDSSLECRQFCRLGLSECISGSCAQVFTDNTIFGLCFD